MHQINKICSKFSLGHIALAILIMIYVLLDPNFTVYCRELKRYASIYVLSFHALSSFPLNLDIENGLSSPIILLSIIETTNPNIDPDITSVR